MLPLAPFPPGCERMFSWYFPYASQRMPVLAKNVVATSQPLAAQAGLAMLAKGGNAVDAGLAAAITLTVVEPTSNGIGSDVFAILWDGQRLVGLNASGRSPAGWTTERFAGKKEMPKHGWDAITVPGAVSAWVALSKRYGKLPFGTLFEAAIRYARESYMVSPITAMSWANQAPNFKGFSEFCWTFLPKDRRLRRPRRRHQRGGRSGVRMEGGAGRDEDRRGGAPDDAQGGSTQDPPDPRGALGGAFELCIHRSRRVPCDLRDHGGGVRRRDRG